MIRINLLKNRGESTSRSTTGTSTNFEQDFASAVSKTSSGEEQSSIFTKVILLAAGTLVLMGYEHYNIGQLQDQVTAANNKRNQLTKEINQKKPIADRAKEQQKKIQDLEAKIKAIKDLSKFRLREIKAIDYIQNNIPDRVWITNLDFNEDVLKIEGGALTDDELNKFLEALDGKSAFRNVILLKAVEDKKKEGTVKHFQITSNLVSVE